MNRRSFLTFLGVAPFVAKLPVPTPVPRMDPVSYYEITSSGVRGRSLYQMILEKQFAQTKEIMAANILNEACDDRA